MKTIGNIITTLAAFAFMLSMCMVDGNPVLAFTIMFISGIVLVIVAFNDEEERIRRGR